MKRIMTEILSTILLEIARVCLMLVEIVVGSQISQINYCSLPLETLEKFEVQFWDKPQVFEWEEYKSCNYKVQLTDEIRITYWDIEEDFNTMKGVNYE